MQQTGIGERTPQRLSSSKRLFRWARAASASVSSPPLASLPRPLVLASLAVSFRLSLVLSASAAELSDASSSLASCRWAQWCNYRNALGNPSKHNASIDPHTYGEVLAGQFISAALLFSRWAWGEGLLSALVPWARRKTWARHRTCTAEATACRWLLHLKLSFKADNSSWKLLTQVHRRPCSGA